MKIVFFELEKWEEDYIKNSFGDTELILVSEKLTQENASKYVDAQAISVFIYSNLNKDLIDKLPNLKFITTRSMGFDHIDTAYCKQKGITVAYVPTYGAHTVAEHTFALMLAVSRKLIPSVERARKGEFGNEGLTGFDLFGKKLGVLGTGHIGKNVTELALAFGMKVLAYNHHEDSGLIEKGVRYVTLEEILATCDIVSLHLPHTKETEHIINMQNVTTFKKGSVLINTARGALVETQAIVYGLQNGIFKGVGIDVLEEEAGLREERELLSTQYLDTVDLKTQLLNHILLTEENVVITPHNAFNSKEALEEILEVTCANIKSYISNVPINVIE